MQKTRAAAQQPWLRLTVLSRLYGLQSLVSSCPLPAASLTRRRPVFIFVICSAQWLRFYGNLYKLSEPFFYLWQPQTIFTAPSLYFSTSCHNSQCPAQFGCLFVPFRSPSAVSWNLNFLSPLRAALSPSALLGFYFSAVVGVSGWAARKLSI